MNDKVAFVAGAPLPMTSHRTTGPFICMNTEEEKPKPAKKPKKTIRSSATWADVWLPGFGRKGPGSRPEWDLRPKSLRTVEEGAGVCDCCKGTGIVTCSFCGGTDFTKADGSITPCPSCKGKKKVQCTTCFGTAKQVELVGQWWRRGLAAMFAE